MKKNLVVLALMGVLVLAAVPTFATTQAVNTNTVSPTLTVNVNVQDAIQLTLATGTGCTVVAAADYSMNFGNVDALAINAPCPGAGAGKFAPITPGVTNSAYWSNYTLTPVFTSQGTTNNTVTAYVSSNFGRPAQLSIVQSTVAPATIAALTPMSTNVAAQTNIATNALSGTPLTRFLGVSVAPTNGAALTGADSAVITYTLTVI
jgi:hypothetical protein